MKSLLKVRSINSAQDVIQEKGEVSIVYDSYFVKEEDFISSIEELGYTVI